MKLSERFSVLALFCALTVGMTHADEQDDPAQALVNILQQVSTISGGFVQVSIDARGNIINESGGDFKAKRPEYFYWKTEAPIAQEIFADEYKVVVYDPDLEQAIEQSAQQSTQNTPAILFSGDPEKVKDAFSVSKEVIGKGEFDTYKLVPRSQDSLFESMLVSFDGLALEELRIGDALGQHSVVRFLDIKINDDIKDSVFIPQLPEGTDFIREGS